MGKTLRFNEYCDGSWEHEHLLMNESITSFKDSAQKSVFHLKEDLKSIRTGRANPSLIENLIVEAYGGQTKMKVLELASIVADGPTALSVTPFDPSVIGDIERAILKSPLGISPAVQGNRILVKIPPLSQEQREKFIKLCNLKVEEKKNAVRNFRDEARKHIKMKFESKEITEDEKFRFEKELDSASQKIMEEIQNIKESKEKEIREV